MDPLVATLVILAVAVVLFFTEWLPSGQTAMLAAAALLVTRALDGEQVFGGFANSATITVGAMFVVSAGVYKSGALGTVGDALSALFSRRPIVAMAALLVGVGVLSAFINNTTVVAIMLPLILHSSRELEASPSRFLMPLSFAAMLGGTATLIGTSTNLIVSSFAEEEGLAPIAMFELAPVGLVFFAAGLLYLLTLGRWLMPERRDPESFVESYQIAEYITDIEIRDGSASVGQYLDEAPVFADVDCHVLALWRDGKTSGRIPHHDTVLRAGDILRVRCDASDITSLLAHADVHVSHVSDDDAANTDGIPLVEAVVGPRSPLVEHTIESIPFRERYGAIVIAVRRHGELIRERLDHISLRAGDVLLLGIERRSIPELERRGDFLLASELTFPRFRESRMPVAIAILTAVVTAAALGVFPIATAAMIGAVLTLVTGCLRLNEAVEAIDWNVMMLLAGVIALGHALESSGAAAIAAHGIVVTLGDVSPVVLVGALYLGTSVITSVLSNNATAALLTPVAISVGVELDVDPRPLVMAIAFGASTALLTPVGYQTNTMVYGAGHYRFLDFARVGAPLTVILTVIAALMIPAIWPL